MMRRVCSSIIVITMCVLGAGYVGFTLCVRCCPLIVCLMSEGGGYHSVREERIVDIKYCGCPRCDEVICLFPFEGRLCP